MKKMIATVLAALVAVLLGGAPSAAAPDPRAPDRYPRQVHVIDIGQDTEAWQVEVRHSGWPQELFAWLDLKEAGVQIGDVLDVVWEPGECTGDGWCPYWTIDVGDFRHNAQPDLSFVLPYGEGFPEYSKPMTNQAHPWLSERPRPGATLHEVSSQVWASDTVIAGWRRIGLGFYDGWMWNADLADEDERVDAYEGEPLAEGDDEAAPGDEPEAEPAAPQAAPADGADPAAVPQAPSGRLWEAWLALAVLAAVIVAVVTRGKRRREDGDEPEPSDE